MLARRTAYPLAQAAADAATNAIPAELAHDPAFCWVKYSYENLVYFEGQLKEVISWGHSGEQLDGIKLAIHLSRLELYRELAKYFEAKLTQGAPVPAPVPTFIISATAFSPA